MTASSLPDFSEPEYEVLPFYTVVENFAFETRKPIGLWLWRMVTGSKKGDKDLKSCYVSCYAATTNKKSTYRKNP